MFGLGIRAVETSPTGNTLIWVEPFGSYKAIWGVVRHGALDWAGYGQDGELVGVRLPAPRPTCPTCGQVTR